MEPTLIHILSGNRWGGIERYALDICKHFNQIGWNVFALTKDAKAVDSYFEKENIKLLHAPLQGFYDYTSIKILSHYLRETQGRVIIHAHGFRMVYTALLARKMSKKKDVKIIMTRHKVRKAVDSWILRLIYRNIDALVFGSLAARDRFVSTWTNRFMPIDPKRMYVLHNSLNIPDPVLTPPTVNHPFTLMFHGTIKSGKGLETLIDALEILKGKRIRLRIVGSGDPDYVDKLRRRSQSRGVMELIDWYKQTDDPFALINECDVGVLPSTQEEAFGIANIEYMAAGRPQISTSHGAQKEYIRDGWEGLLIPPYNASFLAETVTRLALNPGFRQEMGKRALETFRRRLSWPHFIKPLTMIYES